MNSSAAGCAARLFGEFAKGTRYADIPPVEQMRAKGRLLDAVTCVLAGRNSPATKLALGLAEHVQSAGPGSFWLSGARGSLENCAFVNSILIHGTLLDDFPVHTACVVVPSALAVAEEEGRSGEDILAAIALGYEFHLRLNGNNLAHDVLERGFRHSSVNAPFAAAVTAAYLMGLNAEGIKDAIALTTATLNPGTMEPMGKAGSSERFVQMAANAKNGVLAAVLAKAGFTGSNTALEGRAGLFHVYARVPGLPAGLLDGLGTVWHLKDMAIKPYPCSGHGTLPIYCAERLVGAHEFDPTDIVRVELNTRPWGHMLGVVDPGPYTNTEQAMVSACFGVAATLVHGAYDFDVLLRSLGDPGVDALASRIAVEVSEAAIESIAATELKVVLADGRVLSSSGRDMPESMVQQTDWHNLVTRFHRLTRSLPVQMRDRIVSEIGAFDQRENCHELVRMLRTIQ
jgi:2-methylcitrate dehydratase PrpD